MGRACGLGVGACIAALSWGCNVLIGIEDVPVPADAVAPSVGATDAYFSADAPPNATPDATTTEGTESDATTADVSSSTTDTTADGDAGDAGTTCGDTTSSTHNCGRCGHDCLGGACTTSLCQPIALVTAAEHTSPGWIAQDDAFLYWTDSDNDRVYRTDKSAGGAVVLTQSTYLPVPIVVDDAGIYWGDAYGIWQCPKAGCSGGAAFIAPIARSLPFGLAVDEDHVYWTEETSTALLFAAKDGLDASPGVLWQSDASTLFWARDASTDFNTTGVAADGQRVYFTATDGRLRSVLIDGGDVKTAGTPNKAGSRRVAIDTRNAYWSVPDPGAGFMDLAPLDGLTDAGPIASGLSSPGAIATDGVSLYWGAASTDGTGVDIYGCTIASCEPARLAGTFTSPILVVDSQAIYWTDLGTATNTGAVWKLAK